MEPIVQAEWYSDYDALGEPVPAASVLEAPAAAVPAMTTAPPLTA